MGAEAMTQMVDADTAGRVQGVVDEASRSAEDLQAEDLRGTSDAGLLQGQIGFSGQGSVGMDNSAMREAIDRRALGDYRASKAGLKAETQQKSLQTRLSRLTQAAQLAGAEHQQNQQAIMNKYIQKMNRKRSRAAVLGNVLGIAGAVGGAMAGGPAGAMAGYQMGQGVGQLGAQ